jgi:hypothetical protein
MGQKPSSSSSPVASASPAASASAAATLAPSAPPAAATSPELIAPRFEADLLTIEKAYLWLARADGTWWAPPDCVAPTHPAFVSKADAGGHARKIYTLFIKDYDAYAGLSGQQVAAKLQLPAPPELASMAQVIVKEAWTPVEASAPRSACPDDGLTSYLAEVTMDGKAYRACAQAGLFVMYRPAAGTEGTDDGWVYGTVRYERRAETPKVGERWVIPRVTSAGRVASCMGCHTKAPHGRLFGLAASK